MIGRTMKKIGAAILALQLASTAPVLAWDPVKDLTGKRLDQHLNHGARELGNAPESWARCAGRLGRCIPETLERLPSTFSPAAPIVERYKQHLFNQANGRWQTLPFDFINAAQRFYPGIDLHRVRYAEGINTLHGQAITWHYHIFFPDVIDLATENDFELMLHELEHVVQYDQRGGEREFISEYILKVPGKVIERGSFNVHDHIDIERAAIRKAENIFSQVWAQVEQGTQQFAGNQPQFRQYPPYPQYRPAPQPYWNGPLYPRYPRYRPFAPYYGGGFRRY